MLEKCIVDYIHCEIYCFVEEGKNEKEELKRVREINKKDITSWENHCKNYPNADMFKKYLARAKKCKYKICTYSEFLEMEKTHLLSKPIEEITKEIFMDQLNCLPPICWTTIDGIEMFCMSEMWTGTYTTQYAHDHTTNKYYSKMVDVRDKTTWINNVLKNEVRK